MRTLYSVVESVPREYPTITWMAGQPSPGVTLLAVFRKKAGLTTDEFLDRWMDTARFPSKFIHSPATIAISSFAVSPGPERSCTVSLKSG
jgi:hypothetical protein